MPANFVLEDPLWFVVVVAYYSSHLPAPLSGMHSSVQLYWNSCRSNTALSVPSFFYQEDSSHSPHTHKYIVLIYLFLTHSSKHTLSVIFSMFIPDCFSDLKILPLVSRVPLNISPIGSSTLYSFGSLLICLLFWTI